MIWFTSDTHYCHENIIKYCNRPFKDATEMDLEIIKKYNEVVSDDDIVYHLGDFSIDSYTPEIKAQREPYLVNVFKQLKGKKILISGNHDAMYLELYNKLFDSILPYHEIKDENNRVKFVLCHYPFESWNNKNNSSIHLHGHSHGKALKLKNRYDVGIDSNNFYPINIENLIIEVKKQNKILEALKPPKIKIEISENKKLKTKDKIKPKSLKLSPKAKIVALKTKPKSKKNASKS